MRILIVGYYGHLNAGDDLLQQAMSYIFSEHNLTFSSWTPGVSWMNDCDLLVIGGGSIWPNFSIFRQAASVCRRLRVPLMVIGISSKLPDKSAIQGTFTLAAKSVLFHVRDKDTYDLFGATAEITLGVDLFWWMPWFGRRENLNLDSPKSVALALRDWPGGNWSPHNFVNHLIDRGLSIKPLPMHFGSSVHDSGSTKNDVDFLRDLGLSGVTNHFDLPKLFQSDICVAMRFHAILMSVRLGIPVIGLGLHPKIRSFYYDNEIPELYVSLDEPERFSRTLDLIFSRYAHYVAVFASIADRLEEQGRQDLENCRNILSKVQPAGRSGLIRRLFRRLSE